MRPIFRDSFQNRRLGIIRAVGNIIEDSAGDLTGLPSVEQQPRQKQDVGVGDEIECPMKALHLAPRRNLVKCPNEFPDVGFRHRAGAYPPVRFGGEAEYGTLIRTLFGHRPIRRSSPFLVCRRLPFGKPRLPSIRGLFANGIGRAQGQ